MGGAEGTKLDLDFMEMERVSNHNTNVCNFGSLSIRVWMSFDIFWKFRSKESTC